MWNSHIGRKKRTNYEESKREKDSIFSEFFQMFFGEQNHNEEKVRENKSKKVPAKGENIDTEIKVSIKDAFYGAQKKITLRTLNGKMKNFEVKIPSRYSKRRKN